MKCVECSVTYPSKYYFVNQAAGGLVCTVCAELTAEEKQERRKGVDVPATAGHDAADQPLPVRTAESSASLHPLAILSVILGVASIFLFPTRSILAGLVAFGAGFAASRDISRSSGRSTGLKLARAGMVLGCGMAGAWTLTIAVGRLVDYLR